MADKIPPRERTRLYLITPPRIHDVSGFAAILEGALEAGDVASLQIRLKGEDGRIDVAATREVAETVMAMAQAYGAAVLINDSPELAVELGADGVHVGLDDVPVKKAREIIGADMILGATAKNSRHAAMAAGEQGADYVAFGAFYPTGTKAGTVPAELELLEFWQATMELPCVAIGGITVDNAATLVTAGADFLAVSAGVWDHPAGPASAVAAFNALFDQIAEASQP
ncbi:thiamine phosphate synthase [Hyphomonas johnsonii]|uniref:Thiamine-phosphate synthase n=1 Tax=Hyphomonas johnsonii MHS-2 TaxID=1280950 RepID=A0A059FHM3_9PROT|nr:thiamine phosphate synthase [Hyphomonas johnsonii]KCZ90102.1 thiamine-phosphate pyrophosphorylase [Hyphomonas johnsonii MHS-2]